MKFYVSKNGQRYGPYSAEELRKEVSANLFRTEDFVSHDAGRTWMRLDALPEVDPSVYKVEVDVGNNLLVIRYRGRVNPEAVERCADEVAVALQKLAWGFRLTADLSDLQSMDFQCAPHIRKIMKSCNERGVSAVLRIIPDARRDIGLQIMSYFHYGPDVQ
jgi:anti-anti-sigma regulatory factor